MDSVESKTCGHCKEEKSIDKFKTTPQRKAKTGPLG